MSLNEILEIGAIAVGIGALAYGLNEARKKYVNWAEKNKFYDKDVKFSDLEKETNYIGKTVEFEGDNIKEISNSEKINYIKALFQPVVDLYKVGMSNR